MLTITPTVGSDRDSDAPRAYSPFKRLITADMVAFAIPGLRIRLRKVYRVLRAKAMLFSLSDGRVAPLRMQRNSSLRREALWNVNFAEANFQTPFLSAS